MRRSVTDRPCGRTVLWHGLALLVAALGLSACDHLPSTIVFEGAVAQELDVNGHVYFKATTGLWFCRRNLLQSPQPKDWRRAGEYKRKGTRYTLTFRLDDGPVGGICAWKFDGILLRAKQRPPRWGEMSFLSLSSLDEVPVHLKEEQKRIAPGMTVRCSLNSGDPNDLHCDSLQRMIDPMHGETHFKLNVKYEEGHAPTHD